MCASIEMDSQAVSLATGGKKNEGELERRVQEKEMEWSPLGAGRGASVTWTPCPVAEALRLPKATRPLFPALALICALPAGGR